VQYASLIIEQIVSGMIGSGKGCLSKCLLRSVKSETKPTFLSPLGIKKEGAAHLESIAYLRTLSSII